MRDGFCRRNSKLPFQLAGFAPVRNFLALAHPSTVSILPSGAGSPDKNISPKGSAQIINDYGVRGFGGACPPESDGVHRYRFTVHALSVEQLNLPEDASGALAGFMINANTIESSTIEALYQRESSKSTHADRIDYVD